MLSASSLLWRDWLIVALISASGTIVSLIIFATLSTVETDGAVSERVAFAVSFVRSNDASTLPSLLIALRTFVETFSVVVFVSNEEL